jgi:hypothetical protein
VNRISSRKKTGAIRLQTPMPTPYTVISSTYSAAAAKKSMKREHTCASGMISRGK